MSSNCIIVLNVLVLFSLAYGTVGQYDDVRCKCVCPLVILPNSTLPSRRIFVKSFNEPSGCKCENVVDKAIQENQYHFCDLCDCQWQRRNTTTIMVVVMFVILIILMLFLYMFFLECLDPLMTQGPVPYKEQSKEKEEDDDIATERRTVVDTGSIIPGIIYRLKNKMSFVRGEQERWKGAVQEQRDHIYDKRTILN